MEILAPAYYGPASVAVGAAILFVIGGHYLRRSDSSLNARLIAIKDLLQDQEFITSSDSLKAKRLRETDIERLGVYIDNLVPQRNLSHRDDSNSPTQTRLSSPASARYQIARTSEIQKWLCSDALRHLPGVLTGVGIVGTFGGIYQGLGQMRQKLEALATLNATDTSKQVELVTDSVKALFGHVSPAFLASMVCVILAVIFTVIEKLYLKRAQTRATQVADRLDQLFPVIPAERILLNIAEISDQSSAAMRTTLTEIVTVNLESSLKKLLEHQEAQTRILAESLATKISGALEEQLSPMSSTLTEAFKQIKAESSNSTAGMIQDMAIEFKNALASSAGGQLDELSSTLNGTAQLLSGQKEAMASFVDSMRQQMSQQNQLVRESLSQVAEQQEAQSRAFATQLTSTLADVQTALRSMAEESARTSNAGMTAIGKSVNDLLKRSIEIQEMSEAKIRESIHQTQSQLSSQLTEFQSTSSTQIQTISTCVQDLSSKLSNHTAHMMNQLNQTTQSSVTKMTEFLGNSTRSTMELMAKRVQDSMDALEKQTSEVLKSTGHNQKQLTDELRALSQKVSQVTNQTQESSLAIAERTRQTIVAIDSTSKGLLSLIARLEPVGESFVAASDRVKDATVNLKLQSEKSAEASSRVSALVTELKQVHTLLQQQLALHDVRLGGLQTTTTNLRQTVEAFSNVNQTVNRSLEQFSQGSERLFSSISERQNQHSKHVTDALQTYLGKFDKSMAESCSGLQAVVSELTNSLEDFRDDLLAASKAR